ncbi:UDP-glucose 4-epimerase GalE [Spirochaeta thermophila]|uniref:UDP-glucose 4-epimerase n=1 Tax=Winmispira thermophila (strain ATCC 49972 / DSM 6192 / RI 19.B1) TaxID=665571 RepID=E0RPQ1_WINT6|nr:UDP-glucose 4-epimerase GalE [Spirochaeta thermophila]ADN01365.1 UDP-glucose 4-epimerase [Spirochaeta thermophila DSM 6192]
MRFVLTGGAGYIGSHVYRLLKERGHEVVVYDNLSHGHREAVEPADLRVGDLHDTETLREVLLSFKPDVVMHFAAFIEVGISTERPLEFFENNTVGTIRLVQTMMHTGVHHFIFSSTAAVYGHPEKIPIPEDARLTPVNPYGSSKVMVEEFLRSLSEWSPFRYVAIRYFNAAGAAEDGSIGEAHDPETHLIPLILKAAKGERPHITIFGTDFPTPDGTAIRDYIHVDDLAEAHLLAAEYLMDGGESQALNCGYSRGYSVREVIETAKKVTGRDFPVIEGDRRAGDPPALVADSSRMRTILGWKPTRDDLAYIIKTAWNWELNRRY